MKKIIYTLVLVMIVGIFGPNVYADEITDGIKAAYMMEASTGEVLYQYNENEQLPIASITKIMTMLIIMEKISEGVLKYDDLVTASENAASYGGSTMFLEIGEQLTVHDMLKGIAVASANDGCVAMAEHISGTEEAFVELMNKRARELGMENTHFVNSNGLDEEGHYSTARDVAIMSRELISHRDIFNYTTIWMDSLRDGKFELANTNKLIRYYDGATGLKTGSTSVAGCCLSATAERDGMELISVVLGAETTDIRFSSSKKLLNYGFSSYKIVKHIEKDEPVGNVRVTWGKAEEVEVRAAQGYSELLKKSENLDAEKNVHMFDKTFAPVEMGEKLGEITYTKDGKEVCVVDLVAAETVERKGFFGILIDILCWFIPFV